MGALFVDPVAGTGTPAGYAESDTTGGAGPHALAAEGGTAGTAAEGGTASTAAGSGAADTAAEGGTAESAGGSGTGKTAPGDGTMNSDAGDGSAEAFDGGPEPGHAGFASAADERWRTVREVTEAVPSDYTTAGLPRRRRGEKLLPGSAATDEPTEVRPRITRDPADVRGRLSSFQQGVRRGRHAGTVATDTRDEKVEGE